MKIRITWLATGAVLDLQESDSILGPQTTFLELKGFIKMRYGFKPQQLLLVCDQVLCEDDETLKQYGIVSSESAEKKVIGCHVFSMEEAEKEQKELEQEKAFEEEQKKRDAKRAEEAKKRREQQEKDGVDSTKQDDDQEEPTNDSNNKKKTTSILSYNHEDYQKALKILGKEKVAVSKARMSEVAHGNAPTHRPKFLDEQKSAKQMQMLQQAAKDAENAFASSSAGGGNNNNSTFTTGGAPNYMDMVRTSEEWRGREAEKLRRIFKFAEYGDRRKEADEFFKIDYPNYPEGAIELWDVREDIMASIASGADQKPLIIELFYFCELEKGVDMQKLGELVQMKLEQRGLRVKMLGVREAGCTYPLVAVAVTGETPAEIFQLGEVFFEEFGNPDAVSTEQGMMADGGAPAPQEGCVVQ